MDLSTLFEWLKEQASYVLMIIGIIIILVTAAQRRWTAMIGAIIAIAFIGIFVLNPEIIKTMSNWLNDKVNLGG